MDRDRETHRVEKTSNTTLLHREGNALAYDPQQVNSKDPRPVLPYSTRLASLGVCQIWQWGAFLPSSHFPFWIRAA